MIKVFGLKMAATFLSLGISACGTYVPRLEEAWEPVELPLNMEYRIKRQIFCETANAIYSARQSILVDGRPALPDEYGVQMQITLTVEESTNVKPGISFLRTFKDGFGSGIRVGQNFSLGLGADLSSTATKTDTLYSYYNVGRLGSEQNVIACNEPKPHGSSPFLQSDLMIGDFLNGAATQNKIFHSSKVPSKAKEAKSDIFSYDVKFAIVTNGNINPVWKLVNISGNTGSGPLLGAGRTRTHELTLTFGPGEDAPSPASLQTHFTGQIVQQLNRLERGSQF